MPVMTTAAAPDGRIDALKDEIKKLHQLISRHYRGSGATALVTAPLTAGAAAGMTRVEVSNPLLFPIGSVIQIGDEWRVVVGYGSLLLDRPLEHNHSGGEQVVLVERSPLTPEQQQLFNQAAQADEGEREQARMDGHVPSFQVPQLMEQVWRPQVQHQRPAPVAAAPVPVTPITAAAPTALFVAAPIPDAAAPAVAPAPVALVVPTTAPEDVAAAPTDPDQYAQWILQRNPALQAYLKMFKVGVSLQAVRQKMVKDEVDPTVLDPPGTPRAASATPARNLLADIQAPKQLKKAASAAAPPPRPTPALSPQEEMAATLKKREAEKQANAAKLQAAENKRNVALAAAAEAKNKADAAEGPVKVVALAELTSAQAHLSKAEEELKAVKEAQKPKQRQVRATPPLSEEERRRQSRRAAIQGDDDAPAAPAAAPALAKEPAVQGMLARAAAAAPPEQEQDEGSFEGGAYKKLQRKHKKYARYVTRLNQGKMSPSRFQKKVAKLYR